MILSLLSDGGAVEDNSTQLAQAGSSPDPVILGQLIEMARTGHAGLRPAAQGSGLKPEPFLPNPLSREP
jgi:hypothetical protein